MLAYRLGYSAINKNKELQLVLFLKIARKVFQMQMLLLLLIIMPKERLEVSQAIMRFLCQNDNREKPLNPQADFH